MQQRQGVEIRRTDGDALRGSATSHAISCSDQAAVRAATRQAGNMISISLRQMASGPMNIPQDSRLYTPMHYFYTLFFKVEPGIRSMRQILEIKERFRFLRQSLSSARTRCVSDDHPGCRSGQMLHNAFAEVGVTAPRLINLCPAFFRNSPDVQARTIVHELAHARLAVGHRGGRFINFGCSETPLSTFSEAIDNAYVYDNFAYCLYAATSSSSQRGRAP
jgi:hypothetical protein